ncbi:hypothetical protein [Endozoicomonas sp. 4G]|uniref:hypothetical protein n=1 Tax=Endozoicomonas sp. 4G TaxID=2872754 RepID=UPI0020790A6C|nr:hypothetical protein [Endozoicomonas sp. 4G]
MKKTSLLLLLAWLTVTCHAESSIRHFIVEFGDTPLSAKPYSWIPVVEAMAAFGLLMYGRGHYGQQNQPQSQPQRRSSQSQASGIIRHHTAAFSSLMSSGSGGGHQDPKQSRHTLGLNCFVDSCHGVCRFLSQGFERSSTGHTHHDTTETQRDKLGAGRSLLIEIPTSAFRKRENAASIGHLVAGFDPMTSTEPTIKIAWTRSDATAFPLERFRPYGVMVSDTDGHLRELGNHTMSFNCSFDSCNGFCRLGQYDGGGSTEESRRSEVSSASQTHHGMTESQTFQPQAGGHSFFDALLAGLFPISQSSPINNHSTEPAGTLEDSSDTHGAGWDVDSAMDVDPYEE